MDFDHGVGKTEMLSNFRNEMRRYLSLNMPSYRNALPSCSILIHEVAHFLIFLLSYDDLIQILSFIFYLIFIPRGAFFDEHDHVLYQGTHYYSLAT